MDKRYIFVVGRDLQGLARYLYGHSTLVATGANSEVDRKAAIVVVESGDDVVYLTEYQKGRLASSGVWAVSDRNTYDEAADAVDKMFSVRVDRLSE